MDDILFALSIMACDAGKDPILEYLPYLENGVTQVLHEIKDSKNLETMQVQFNILEAAISPLAALKLRYHVPLSDRLNELVCDFEQIHALDYRPYAYEQIKSGKALKGFFYDTKKSQDS